MDNFIHTLFDESIIEYILTKSLIFDGMDENDKQIIDIDFCDVTIFIKLNSILSMVIAN